MTTRYLIGQGERLTYPIDIVRGGGDKKHPYSVAEAQQALAPRMEAASSVLDQLPAAACPQDLAVASLVLHPAYLAKTYFPRIFLHRAGLESIGSRSIRIAPRKQVKANATAFADTTEIFVAGTRSALRELAAFTSAVQAETAEGGQLRTFEDFRPMTAMDRIRSALNPDARVFEIGLHVPQGMDAMGLRQQFAKFAQMCGCEVDPVMNFVAGRLLFVPLSGTPASVARASDFTLVRVAREMPKLRPTTPTMRTAGPGLRVQLPTEPPLSTEPRVAILDGGLPQSHALGPLVRRYVRSDEEAGDVDSFLAHGLGVTSAVLFGPITPSGVAQRPYSNVSHYRVLDEKLNSEDPLELYRTLGHVETILLSRSYEFVNLSLGPDLCIEDEDVHAWTAVIDGILSDGKTLMSVAAGNNGERIDMHRVQVPADCVNAIAIGASDRSGVEWARAAYSARGPGRSPGLLKPDCLAFGGSPHEYFHVVAPGHSAVMTGTYGTSFAAPLALRTGIGIRAILGPTVSPLAIKALLVHGAKPHPTENASQVGWGRIPIDVADIITCGDGVARIIYQGEFSPGKFLRAPVPLPVGDLTGMVTLTATFCYASPVNPENASEYTKAGLGISFRPHQEKRDEDAQHATTKGFFSSSRYRTEAEQRDDLHKWETVLHDTHRFRAQSLKGAVFDVHYNARDGGGLAGAGSPHIPYALVLTVHAPNHPNLYEDILANHAVLEQLKPTIDLNVRTGT